MRLKQTITIFSFIVLASGKALAADCISGDQSTGTCTVPSGITSIKVQAWGAGGSGGMGVASSSNFYAGGGGGGGSYCGNTVSVTPGQSLTITLGTGGVLPADVPAATTVTGLTGDDIVANSGYAGKDSATATTGAGGAGGSASGCTYTGFAGGAGGSGGYAASNPSGGGGGGSADSSGSGNAGGNSLGITPSGGLGGLAGGADGGNGGAGGNFPSGTGSAGLNPGGGGGGGAWDNGSGGDGGAGKVVFIFQNDTSDGAAYHQCRFFGNCRR